MIKTTTLNDLLAYAYNETGLSDSDRIQRSLDGDPCLMKEYQELNEVLNILDSAAPPVSQESINEILKFC